MARKRVALSSIVFIALGVIIILSAALLLSRMIARRNRPNVLIIAVDALRPDRLGCYGAEDALSPAIDSLAAQGVIFLNATTQAPATGPSFSTLMTSRYPLVHGVTLSGMSLEPEQLTLAEVLQQAGYQTAAFPGSVILHRESGLDQGFQTYESLPEGGMPYRDAAEVNSFLLPWLEAHTDRPFFALVHYMETHDPYRYHDPQAPYTIERDRIETIYKEQIELDEAEICRIRAAYDSEVTHVDQHIENVLRKLEELDVRRRTIIILTADHGELLYEHERGFGHSRYLYQETALVPLIIASPPILPQNTKVDAIVELRDLAPTILDLSGIPAPSEFEGRSLLGLMNGEESEDFYLAYTMREPWTFLTGGPAHALRIGDWKLIQFEDGTDLLFDLSSDPQEQTNLAQKRPDITNPLRDRLLNMVRSQTKRTTRAHLPESISEETLERLRSLGYID
jgi:arylsulfatase A-like enzyme